MDLHQNRRRTPAAYLFFFLGYLVLAVLVQKQSDTIESQRRLILALYSDSNELMVKKVREASIMRSE